MDDSSDPNSPDLHLTPEEKRIYGQLFQQADSDGLGVVTGEAAVKFFERTTLSSDVLGQIWQIADTENRGLLTKSGFFIVLRLIGQYQASKKTPTWELALRPAPPPRFSGIDTGPPPSSPISAQNTGTGPIRVPPLIAEKVGEYSTLFGRAGAQNGLLSGGDAKTIFEKARLPNEVLGQIWTLSDTKQRGQLDVTEFAIAMHLITSYKSGQMRAIPQTLPPGLYEAASRRPGSAAIPRQYTGQETSRPQSPGNRYSTPPMSAQSTGQNWLITPQEKTKYDQFFASIDTEGGGHISGDQAVSFFSNSNLPEDTLASIWDLADINSAGQLTRDEFAVAMYLIRQQRSTPRPPLPSTLPPMLIPPSMRQAPPRPTQQSLAAEAFGPPAQATPQPPPPQPRSASEDLFGLDAFTSPPAAAPTQVQQSTGGSVEALGNKGTSSPSPRAARATSPLAASSSSFKPFMPSSSFGQTLQQQGTGTSTTRAAPPSSAADDDLLGDNDPEISKKLTNETTELANMSNQIGTLTNQMQDVQKKRDTTTNDLTATTNQKKQLEARLTEFRARYQQEVEAVKKLEERLTASRTETKKLQQDIAMIEGTYQDLQAQHKQVEGSLTADQNENASLKQRISAMNAEISQLRPQLEKMRSDARQQKGLVAINKKQLATNEGERNKMKTEMDELAAAPPPEPVREAQSPPPEARAVVSPSPSTSSNPFFRKASQQGAEMARAPSFSANDGGRGTPKANFDDIFGGFSAPSRATPPPQTSFRSESPAAAAALTPAATGLSTASSEGHAIATPGSATQESPSAFEEPPPPPPESRQFTPGNLGTGVPFPRTTSLTSSTKVLPSETASHADAGSATPTTIASPAATPFEKNKQLQYEDLAARGPVPETSNEAMKRDVNGYGAPPADRQDSIPGAFPDAAFITPNSTGPTVDKGKGRADDTVPFKGQEPGAPQAGINEDFDAAFAGFGSAKSAGSEDVFAPKQSVVQAAEPAPKAHNEEFPPIQDLANDDEEDSSDEEAGGFGDNFTTQSPDKAKTLHPAGNSAEQRPPLSQLPSAGAEMSPPAYSSDTTAARKDSTSGFPREFDGLLPSREDPTSPVNQATTAPAEQHPHTTTVAPVSSPTPPPTETHSAFAPPEPQPTLPATSHSNGAAAAAVAPPVEHAKQPFGDDFDDFDDLHDAHEAEADTGDDFGFSSQTTNGGFNPTFDSSPAPSKSSSRFPERTSSQGLGDSFADFTPTQRSVGSFPIGGAKAPETSHDWDEIFAGLDNSSSEVDKSGAKTDVAPAPALGAAGSSSGLAPTKPNLARAISTGTEHDDPILKKLTGMGYARSDALAALEKYDYDISRAADYLTSNH